MKEKREEKKLSLPLKLLFIFNYFAMLVFTITSHHYHIIRKQCIATQAAYAKRMGYEYRHIILPDTLTADSTARSKLYFLRSFLSSHKRVMYIDADCQVNINCPDMTSLAQSGKSIFVAPGFSGRINSGVIIAQDSPDAIQAISQVIVSKSQELPDADKVGRIYGGGENGHVIHYWKNNPTVALIDQKRNNNHTPELDDYIRHYSAGGPMRSLYKMDLSSRFFRSLLMIQTFLKKFFIKIGLVSRPEKLQQDIESVVQKLLYSS